MNAGERINEHTAIPAKPDLIRMGIGIIGIGTSGPLIAMSAMPILTLIFWRNLGDRSSHYLLHCDMHAIVPG
jgi:hypothetical protein